MEATGVFGRPKLGSRLSICSQTNAFTACKLSSFRLKTSYPIKHAHGLVPLKASKTTHPLACEGEEEYNRNFEKLAPSEWGHQFLSAHVDLSEMDALRIEIETLKPKVRDMFMLSSEGIKSTKKNIMFIYLLVSLGLAYHFEDEIEEALRDGFRKMEEEDMMSGEDDLYTKFKGDNGKFKECLARDPKGILSLYEAAHMGTTTDYILDEAMSFAKSHLEEFSSAAANGSCKRNLSRRILKALDQPQHKNMEIFVAMEYIHFYEQEQDCDKTLLNFAKLNFKFLQLLYLQELQILSKWYKEQDLESKLSPYFRDRIVEVHLVTLTYFEPKYSRVRIFLSKIYTLQIIIDDTCDRYASLCEVESLADTIERWDPDDYAMDGQADYLKYVVKFIFDTFQEFERECKRVMRNNLKLAQWARKGHLPSFDEYLDVAGVEIAIYFTLAGILMGMESICKKEAHEWLKARDKLVRALITKTRVVNDMLGFEDDMSRGYVTNSINCYKKQYGVTEEEAIRKLRQLVAYLDKIMNEEFLKTINVPREVLKVVIIDTARAANVSYEKDDEFTRPGDHLKNYIKSMYIDL
ncbi:terpenoid synthase 28 isoform X2 [Capsella rubella]|uniref:terpenoid synthase 28 isoform X2 n=1 Tax=Capsella rubella TaxID=81985 RepID=UPI000CD55F29|nr:terpenoid synthase 28 isoform X2 [Capsella rubella]